MTTSVLQDPLHAEFLQELKAIEAESIGWLPLARDVYLHVGAQDEQDYVIEVVGIADASMAGTNVLWLV